MAAAVLLAACGGGEDAAREDPSTSTSAADPTTTTAVSTGEPAPLPSSGELEPGRYVPSTMGFPIEFEVPSGWSVLQDLRTGLTLLRRPEPGDQALTFDITFADEPPRARVEFLAGLRGLTPGPVEDTTLFGLPAVTALVGAVDQGVSVPTLAEHYTLRAGDVVRIYAVVVGATTVTVLVEATTDTFDAFATEAAAVLDSVGLPAG